MAGHSATLIKNYYAGAAVTRRRIIKHGAADNQVLLGAAATDSLIGISTDVDAATGEPCDVIREGFADVEYGGAVVRGGPITSDATGRAIAAVPAAGSNVRIIGFAEVSAVVGDIGAAYISPSIMQG